MPPNRPFRGIPSFLLKRNKINLSKISPSKIIIPKPSVKRACTKELRRAKIACSKPIACPQPVCTKPVGTAIKTLSGKLPLATRRCGNFPRLLRTMKYVFEYVHVYVIKYCPTTLFATFQVVEKVLRKGYSLREGSDCSGKLRKGSFQESCEMSQEFQPK